MTDEQHINRRLLKATALAARPRASWPLASMPIPCTSAMARWPGRRDYGSVLRPRPPGCGGVMTVGRWEGFRDRLDTGKSVLSVNHMYSIFAVWESIPGFAALPLVC